MRTDIHIGVFDAFIFRLYNRINFHYSNCCYGLYPGETDRQATGLSYRSNEYANSHFIQYSENSIKTLQVRVAPLL
jgi:hypothetical protein